jgi:hypothetical protein
MQDTLTMAELAEPHDYDGSHFAVTDQGGQYKVLAFTSAGPIVQGMQTAQLARLVQTGRRVAAGQVRCRFDFARDLEGVEGDIVFDASSTRGVAPEAVFIR